MATRSLGGDLASQWQGLEASTAGKVISYLSITSHYESFARGVVDLKDVVYYLSAIFLGLFLTSRSLEALKWRA